MSHSLKSLFESKTLQFIFVGGKGGVGKTTTASSIAITLAQTRGRTLLISTDPAHNLSDAFNQQFSHEPVAVDGVENLFAMEVDPKKALELTSVKIFEGEDDLLGFSKENTGFIEQLLGNFPGIDEAVVFMKLIAMAKEMKTEVVVFDTAPTGHTLKLLAFPKIITEALGKVGQLKEKLGGLFSMFGGNSNDNKIERMFEKL